VIVSGGAQQERRRIFREATMRCPATSVLGAVVIGAAMTDLIGARLLQVTQPTVTTLVSSAPVTNDPGRENLLVSNGRGVDSDNATPTTSLPRPVAPTDNRQIVQDRVGEYYEWETVEPGRVEMRTRAAVYKTLATPIVERPAYIRRFHYYDMAGDLWISQEYVPAEVRYVSRKVLIEPERQETIVIPPKQRLVKRLR
jgi:hypothetical protein